MARNLGVVVFSTGSSPVPIAGARIYLSTPERGAAGGPDNPANWITTNADGYVLDLAQPDGYPDWMWIDTPGYLRYEIGFATQAGPVVALPPGNVDIVVGPAGTARPDQTQLPPLEIGWDPTPPIPPATGPLPRLSMSGYNFLADGVPILLHGSTELVLGEIYERGIPGVWAPGADSVRAICRDRRAVLARPGTGVFLRFLCQHQYRGPWQMAVPNIRALIDLCESEGLYSMPSVLADNWTSNDAAHQRLLDVAQGILGSASLPQAGNEFDKNGYDPRSWPKPPGGPWAQASTTVGFNGIDCLLPAWDHAWYSARRDYPKSIIAYDALETTFLSTHCATALGEGFKPGVDSSNPDDYRRAGRLADAGCGGIFHTVAGTSGNCARFTDLERACARAFCGR